MDDLEKISFDQVWKKIEKIYAAKDLFFDLDYPIEPIETLDPEFVATAQSIFDRTVEWFRKSKLISRDYPVRLEVKTRREIRKEWGRGTVSGECYAYHLVDGNAPFRKSFGSTIVVGSDIGKSPSFVEYPLDLCIAHEMIHAEQLFRGDLEPYPVPGSKYYFTNWKGQKMESFTWKKQKDLPWEAEAYGRMYNVRDAIMENRPEDKKTFFESFFEGFFKAKT